MRFFKKYTSIPNFLLRFTLIKIGKLHIRIHRILSEDKTTLFHNHPFYYISFIVKGGYIEEQLQADGNVKTTYYGRFSMLFRSKNTYHRIKSVITPTTTLFIAFGNYGWNAVNITTPEQSDGVYQRFVVGKHLWSKYKNGIWFIGNNSKSIASKENRHSIHQVEM